MTAAESTAGSTTIAIDRTLADLIVVGMLAKHAQWNIVGPVCRSMGALFDGLADMSRRHSDAIAERAAILGHHPDGRAETIGRDNTLPTVHAGELTDDTAIRAFTPSSRASSPVFTRRSRMLQMTRSRETCSRTSSALSSVRHG